MSGLRLAGAFDGFELAVRAILGQQASARVASTLAGRLVTELGEPLAVPSGSITPLFPSTDQVAPADLFSIGVPQRKREAILALADAVATGDVVLDGSVDPVQTTDHLTDLPGIGPWTSSYVAMRALRDPDAMPLSDLGIGRALSGLSGESSAGTVRDRTAVWRPWRGYGAMHLWMWLTSN